MNSKPSPAIPSCQRAYSVSPSRVEELEDALAFLTTYARSRYRSSLAFVDNSGQVVGTLDDSVKFVEDAGVSQLKDGDRIGAKAPVILSVDDKASVAESREVRVRAADGLGDSLLSYSEIISETIVKGADVLGHGIVGGSQKLKAHISPNQQPLTFSAGTTENLRRAKSLSATAVKVTSKVVETAVRMAVTIGSTILDAAGNISDKSSAPSSTKGKTEKVKIIGAKLARAIGNVSSGVDRGARILWNASSASTASLVGHRYGTEAGDVIADALNVAENLTLVYFDSKGIARRVIVRRAAGKLIQGNAVPQSAPAGHAAIAMTPRRRSEGIPQRDTSQFE